MTELEVETIGTYRMAVRIWWAVLMETVAFYLLGFLPVACLLVAFGMERVGDWLFPVLTVGLEIFILSGILKKRFKTFRLAVFAGDAEVRPSARMTLRFWWAFSWRVYVRILPFILLQTALAYGVGNLPREAAVTAALLCFVLEICFSIQVFRKIINKDFGTFRVTVLQRQILPAGAN